MMCNFVARTNQSNIKSNYFIHTIIVFNLPNYTNETITVTFINQAMLCHTLVFFFLENDPHKSSAILQINLYVFFIHTEIPNGTNKLNHVERLSVFQNEPFAIPYGRTNHLCRCWNNCMLTIVQNTFYSHHAWWLPLVDETFVINSSVAVSIRFFWTWCDKWSCQAWLRPSNRKRWFFVYGLFLWQAHCYENQWNTAFMEAAVVSIMQTPAILLWFPEKWLFGFFILEKQFASKNMFLVRSELSITTYIFLVFYRSTSLQSRSFLKIIETFPCK
jgi:hypothetical protein